MHEQIILSDEQSHGPLTVESAHPEANIDWKERSDTAYLAGFVAIASIFSRFSIAPLIWWIFRLFQHQPGMFDLSRPGEALASTLFTLAIPLPGLLAPIALWFSIKAFSDLKRNSNKSGLGQAFVALLVGGVGTVILLAEIAQVAFTLMR